ncbi:hypothetical protein [Parasutterella excrementihominis]|uniref:hypothetical protein n=1 Tax=Parasutterella excrementihominis TaxID=487175 RepID=UPI0012BC30D3|nr:hypothetical protein [Parasutterella excrementihominis]MTT64689.1 hypothetical protein [Parasutterella excrementihominis]MTT93009.1 hypothetical protein [Parasutterella excrementihominis]
MARKILPLLSQKQVDQAIKNFIVETNPRSAKIRLCLNGGTAIAFEIYKDYVRAYRALKQTWVFLGYYYSEDLETDPEINYQMPPAPFYTYEEIISRGEEVKKYGRVISDAPIGKINVKDLKCVNGKLVPNDFYKDYPIQPPSISIVDPFRFKSLADSVKESLNEQPAPAKAAALNPESVGVSEKKEAVSTSPKTNENDNLKESLERRLRLLDLKIEREEILNQLAAL